MGRCLPGSSLRKPGILDLKCTQSTVKDQIQCKTKGQGEPPKRELQSSPGVVRNPGSTLQMEIRDFSSCPWIAGSSHSPPIPGDKGTVLSPTSLLPPAAAVKAEAKPKSSFTGVGKEKSSPVWKRCQRSRPQQPFLGQEVAFAVSLTTTAIH